MKASKRIVEKRAIIDDRRDAYKTFFDHKWAKTIMEDVEGTILHDPVFDLIFSWRTAANTHLLPWLMVEQLKGYHMGSSRVLEPVSIEIARGLSTVIAKRLGDRVNGDLLLDIQDVIRQAADEMQFLRSQDEPDIDPDEIWQSYLPLSEFRFGILGSQRLAYGAVYYAYEDFLARCYRLVVGDDGYRIITNKFAGDMAQCFGQDVCDKCWTDPQVNLARLTRHALVHNGGRLTPHLRNEQHNLRIRLVKEELQICPDDTRELFRLLKDRATRFIKATQSCNANS